MIIRGINIKLLTYIEIIIYNEQRYHIDILTQISM